MSTSQQYESSQPIVPTKKEDLHYNSHLEELVASEAEKSLCLRWLHDQSEKRYAHFNTVIQFPIIVISALAGTASIGQDSLFGSSQAAPIIIGMMSLTVTILNVISNFFGWAKRSEGHRISGINYGKLHRWISIELALPREQRVPAKHFLKEIREQVDRLNETSPPVPQIVITSFRTTMKNLKDNVSVPEICNEIHNVEIYRGSNREDISEQDDRVSVASNVQIEMTNPLYQHTEQLQNQVVSTVQEQVQQQVLQPMQQMQQQVIQPMQQILQQAQNVQKAVRSTSRTSTRNN
jgi:hypothetical protein